MMTTNKRKLERRKVPPLVRHDAEFLADQIDAVATLMEAMAERMEYYAGFRGELNQHALEMAGASAIARGWAYAIRNPNAPLHLQGGATAEPCKSESGCSTGGDMGIGPFSTCSLTPPASPVRYPNPNPARFRILRTLQVGRSVVVEVRYPDCTNYEGRKVLVYADTDAGAVRAETTLDPHFAQHGGPLARLEPTERGWSLAVGVARMSNAGVHTPSGAR